ncbi:MAG: hypothetical protein LBH16_10850 [Treponema sp.]|jgi:hypothetical protein|nr:hypothetical protein [Treponema sp.]
MTEIINPVKITVSQEDYDNYVQRNRNNYPQNTRIRPDDMDFFDALLSVDMTTTQEGLNILNAISKLD